jgi:hypothetical protein
MSQHGVLVDEEAAQIPDTTFLAETKETEGAMGAPSVSSNDSKAPVAALDWDSPEDIGNPRNWSTWKRVYHTSIPALYGFVM